MKTDMYERINRKIDGEIDKQTDTVNLWSPCLDYHAVLLPARTSEQGNVIRLVSVYVYVCVQNKL